MSEINGQAPPPPQDQAAGGATSERLMGAFGLLFALVVGLMAVDLLTGGGVSRLLPARGEGGDDNAG